MVRGNQEQPVPGIGSIVNYILTGAPEGNISKTLIANNEVVSDFLPSEAHSGGRGGLGEDGGNRCYPSFLVETFNHHGNGNAYAPEVPIDYSGLFLYYLLFNLTS
ncbi:MAG: hypothetical protein ACE5GI_06675 [Candidatus Aminicenantales bacterium]